MEIYILSGIFYSHINIIRCVSISVLYVDKIAVSFAPPLYIILRDHSCACRGLRVATFFKVTV